MTQITIEDSSTDESPVVMYGDVLVQPDGYMLYVVQLDIRQLRLVSASSLSRFNDQQVEGKTVKEIELEFDLPGLRLVDSVKITYK